MAPRVIRAFRVCSVACLVCVSSPVPGRQPTGGAASLRAPDVLWLGRRLAKFADDLPDPARLGVAEIVAYEENKHFAYLRGTGPAGDRRVLLCKPGALLVDDHPKRPGPWRLLGRQARTLGKTGFAVTEAGGTVTGWALLPKGPALRVSLADGGVTVTGLGNPAPRFVQVLHVGDGAAKEANCKLSQAGDVVTLTHTAPDRTYTVSLPADPNRPGTIAVAGSGGKALLARRLLPAGVMPHGKKGVAMLERWDGAYRRNHLPGWDVGRPASELQKAVQAGTLKPGRAVVLGCGTGTNAIHLAQRGFTVTGIDVAPTALALAERKAEKAGVRVTWLVADVLAPPPLEPFDVIFDRGCYHGVRRVSAAGYMKTVNALSRPGTLMLLLAGNANQSARGGPPRVDEPELVGDFAKTWDFVSLREARFDSRDPNRKSGAWMWAALLRRRPQSE